MTAGTSLICNAGIGGNMIPIFTEQSIKQLSTVYDNENSWRFLPVFVESKGVESALGI